MCLSLSLSLREVAYTWVCVFLRLMLTESIRLQESLAHRKVEPKAASLDGSWPLSSHPYQIPAYLTVPAFLRRRYPSIKSHGSSASKLQRRAPDSLANPHPQLAGSHSPVRHTVIEDLEFKRFILCCAYVSLCVRECV